MFLLLLIACASASWFEVPTTGIAPSVRSWPAVADYDDHFIVFGGTHDDFATQNFTFYNDLYSFNPSMSSWTLLEPVGQKPAPRAFACGSGDSEGNFYVYGGVKYNSIFTELEIYDDFWKYDPSTNSWEEIVTCFNPGARTGAMTLIQGDKLYLFGGLDSYYNGLNDVWVFDFRTEKWKHLDPWLALQGKPAGQQYSLFQKFGSLLYVGAGEAGAEGDFGFADTNWVFDLITRSWWKLNPSPNYHPQRNYIGQIRFGGKIITYGGDTPTDRPACCGTPYPQNPTNQTWVYEFLLNRWTLSSASAPAIKRHRCVSVGGYGYIVSGWGWAQDHGQLWNDKLYAVQLSNV